ncbi:MAG: type II secretion system minor pseudopilin GspK [Nitrospinota bacterium]
MKNAINNESGTALLVTLVVIVIMTVTVTEFMYATWVEASLAANFRDDARAVSIVGSAVTAAREVIKVSSSQEMNELINFFPEVPLVVEDTYAFVRIEDESGKLDMNLLDGDSYSEKRVEVFRRLLQQLGLDPDISNAVVDWIDSDGEVNGARGAEDGYYISLERPYPCKNAKLDSLEELKRIRGVTPEVYAKIKPFVTIRSDKKININTAPFRVILALHENITKTMARDLINRRYSTLFVNKIDIKNVPGFDDTIYIGDNGISGIIDVTSATFSITASVELGEVSRTARAIYVSIGNGAKGKTAYFAIKGGLS